MKQSISGGFKNLKFVVKFSAWPKKHKMEVTASNDSKIQKQTLQENMYSTKTE